MVINVYALAFRLAMEYSLRFTCSMISHTASFHGLENEEPRFLQQALSDVVLNQIASMLGGPAMKIGPASSKVCVVGINTLLFTIGRLWCASQMG